MFCLRCKTQTETLTLFGIDVIYTMPIHFGCNKVSGIKHKDGTMCGGEMARTSHDRLSKSNANYIFISSELPCVPDLSISLSVPNIFCMLKLLSVWFNQSFQDIQFTNVSLFKHLVAFYVKIRFPALQIEFVNFSWQTMISQRLFYLDFPLPSFGVLS